MWNLHWDTMWKLHAEKMWFWETEISSWQNEKNWGKIGFTFSTLTVWWKWKILHWVTMWYWTWMWPGTMWRCGGVLCTKNYSPPSGNREYYTIVPQYEMLHSRTLCWFAYFVASRVCQRSVFLSSIEYRINIEIECYHSYNNCYILIIRTVSLLSPYHRTHCLPDTSSLQSRRYRGIMISYSSTATTVYRIRLITLPH